MNNFLDNGAILPFGLLGSDHAHDMHGFNKTYRNYPLRVGVVTASYPASDKKNKSKLATEYDVVVLEQIEDKGSTTILYRNCMAAEAMGSIADFFEKNLRPSKKKTSKGDAVDTKSQDGAIVLILCLDGISDKAVIIASLTHPDRKTTLKDDQPRMEGEYNGINIKVETDGSTTLTFRGATDNSGKVINDQGPTFVAIEKDGSFQTKHKTITSRLDKNGKASLTADDNISNTTKKDFSVAADGNVALTAKKDFSLESVKLTAKASGSASLSCDSMEVNSQGAVSLKGSQISVEAQSMAKIKATQITLDGMVALGGSGGQPVLLMTAMMIGTGNLSAPVISFAVSGFTTKVLAT